MVGEYGLSPSEYWRMTPHEIWSIIELKRPKQIHGVPEDDYYNMLKRYKELEEQGVKVL